VLKIKTKRNEMKTNNDAMPKIVILMDERDLTHDEYKD
jgi:hypothetical protein